MEESELTIEDEYGSTLLNAFALTHGDRNTSYGPFVEDYSRVSSVFSALCDGEPVEMDAAYALLFMVSMKLSRVAHALHTGMAYEEPQMVEDSIIDASGYLDGLWQVLNHPPEYDIEEWEDDPEEEELEDEEDWDDEE
jgi:hypothetical protein